MRLNAMVKKALFLILIFCLLAAAVVIGYRMSRSKGSSGSSRGSVPRGISEELSKIVSRRSFWNPIFANLYGNKMPNFAVKDIEGKTHRLGEYYGKNVLVVIWATWCLPCVQEIPHLVALREIMPADKLAILAISNEPAGVVRSMAEAKNINYTVVSYPSVLPAPFGSVRGVPSSFFIRPDGRLKLAIEGSSYLGEMKAIILAE